MKKQRFIDFAVILAVTVLFSILVCFVDVAAIGPAGTKVGFSHINGFFRDMIPLNMVLYRVTNLAFSSFRLPLNTPVCSPAIAPSCTTRIRSTDITEKTQGT